MQILFTDRRYVLQVKTILDDDFFLHISFQKVSMYQMAVLLLFNKSHRWTVQEMEDETKIQREVLICTISSLLQSRLLTCLRMTEDSAKIDIDSNDNIELSADFHK